MTGGTLLAVAGCLFVAGGAGVTAVRRATRAAPALPHVWVPPTPFDPAFVVDGMLEEAARCGSSEYVDLDRVLSLKLCPELEEPWRATYNGWATYHPDIQDARRSLYARSVAGIETVRRRVRS